MSYRVTGLFCVAGNPTKAWAGTTGEEDEEHVPDDVWEEQAWEFDEILDAKAAIKELHPQMSTHVALEAKVDDEWQVICYMDSDADHLDSAEVGVMMPSEAPPQPLPGENVVDESLTPYEAMEA